MADRTRERSASRSRSRSRDPVAEGEVVPATDAVKSEDVQDATNEEVNDAGAVDNNNAGDGDGAMDAAPVEIYIGNLDFNTRDQDLEDEFRKQLADLDITKTPYEMNEDVSSPYIYQVGDLVQNINPTCPHHGSKGIVMSVEPEELTYSVTNSGDTFKPGMRLTKTLDQLETM